MPNPTPAQLLALAASCALLPTACTHTASTTTPEARAAQNQSDQQAVQAIRDTEAAWVKAFATKIPEKAAAFYADDAASMLPDTPLMTGKQAILAGMRPELGDPNFSLTFAPTKIHIAGSGDIAYTQGRFRYTTTDPKTHRVVGQWGNYVEVYKKQPDGSWKVEEDIATEETPLRVLKPGE
ncbi:MAG TPA: DUF4440 domain-containing protein [Terracidiphilus sp.]|nr:DUF4440 domain-containing protein [Terracidiphilus sp.]